MMIFIDIRCLIPCDYENVDLHVRLMSSLIPGLGLCEVLRTGSPSWWADFVFAPPVSWLRECVAASKHPSRLPFVPRGAPGWAPKQARWCRARSCVESTIQIGKGVPRMMTT